VQDRGTAIIDEFDGFLIDPEARRCVVVPDLHSVVTGA
jgi:hypothetical protein